MVLIKSNINNSYQFPLAKSESGVAIIKIPGWLPQIAEQLLSSIFNHFLQKKRKRGKGV